MRAEPPTHSVRTGWLIAAAVGVALGCLLPAAAPAAPGPQMGRAVEARTCPGGHCSGEPTVAADATGRIFVTDVDGEGIAVSSDGGNTFSALPAPPIPAETPSGTLWAGPGGDAIVQSHGPDLFFAQPLAQGWNLKPAPKSEGINPATYSYSGIQVARSSDGGRTWRSNLIVGLPPGSHSATVGVDRPWLAFGHDRHVYLTWLQEPPTTDLAQPPIDNPTVIDIARSDDGGATFTQLGPVVPSDGRSVMAAGAPAVAPDGLLLIPFIASPATSSQHTDRVELARSADEGRSFSLSTAYDTSASHCLDQTGNAPCDDAGWHFPSVVLDGPTHVDLAWWRGDGIWVAVSPDRGTHWTTHRWTPGPPAEAGPWALVPAPGQLDVAWYRATANPQQSQLCLSTGPAAGTARFTVVAGTITQNPYAFSSANSDFASMARLPNGRAALVWESGPIWLRVAH